MPCANLILEIGRLRAEAKGAGCPLTRRDSCGSVLRGHARSAGAASVSQSTKCVHPPIVEYWFVCRAAGTNRLRATHRGREQLR